MGKSTINGMLRAAFAGVLVLAIVGTAAALWDHESRLATNETHWEHVAKSLERIEAKIDKVGE